MVSEKTREEDERLRQELRHVDLEKLKKVIKPLLRSDPKAKKPTGPSEAPSAKKDVR